MNLDINGGLTWTSMGGELGPPGGVNLGSRGVNFDLQGGANL